MPLSLSSSSRGDSTATVTVPSHLHSVAALSLLLEKLDRQPRDASAGQYRQVAQALTGLLEGAVADEDLRNLLDIFPAAAELYENECYARAGLCRAPLGAAVESEMATRTLMRRLSLAGPRG